MIRDHVTLVDDLMDKEISGEAGSIEYLRDEVLPELGGYGPYEDDILKAIHHIERGEWVKANSTLYGLVNIHILINGQLPEDN